jgi:hypothetical protein
LVFKKNANFFAENCDHNIDPLGQRRRIEAGRLVVVRRRIFGNQGPMFLKNIFAEKFGEKIGVFDSKQS